MPKGNLPKHAREIFDAAEASALKGTCKGDKGCAASIGWTAVKKKYKKVGDKWVAKSEALTELSLYISKASFDKSTQQRRWEAIGSDTNRDSYNTRMSISLFEDFIRRAEAGEKPPPEYCSEAWCGGMPYLSVSHYSDLDGDGVAGDTEKMFIDGNKFKSRGTFRNTRLGIAAFDSLCADLYGKEQRSEDEKIRISIGFLDYAHAHGDNFVFERKSLADKCPMCAEGVGEITYLKGLLLHQAMTRVPVNKRTEIALEERAMTTRREDAASIVGEELADELEEKSALVGRSEAEVERAEDVDELEETVVEGEEVEENVEEVSESEVVESEVEESGESVEERGFTSFKDYKNYIDAQKELNRIYDNWLILSEVMYGILQDGSGSDKKKMISQALKDFKSELEIRALVTLSNLDNPEPEDAHVLAGAFDEFRGKFDEIAQSEISRDEKLQALQEPFNTLAMIVRSAFDNPSVDTVSQEEPNDGNFVTQAQLGDALQPINEKLALLVETLSNPKRSQETTQPANPPRRSFVPQILQSAIKQEQVKPGSIRDIARKTTGAL